MAPATWVGTNLCELGGGRELGGRSSTRREELFGGRNVKALPQRSTESACFLRKAGDRFIHKLETISEGPQGFPPTRVSRPPPHSLPRREPSETLVRRKQRDAGLIERPSQGFLAHRTGVRGGTPRVPGGTQPSASSPLSSPLRLGRFLLGQLWPPINGPCPLGGGQQWPRFLGQSVLRPHGGPFHPGHSKSFQRGKGIDSAKGVGVTNGEPPHILCYWDAHPVPRRANVGTSPRTGFAISVFQQIIPLCG